MTAEDKAELLKLIESGHDPEAAAIAVGLPVSLVNSPKPQLKKALDAALRVGTARLRGKIMELALKGDNVQALERQLERREAVVDDTGIGCIERRIVPGNGRCVHCHKPPFSPRNGKPTNGEAAT